VTTLYTLKHFKIALAAFFVALGLGTLAFKLVGHESVLASFYRATVTISLTGIDSRPPHVGAQIVTVLVILAGMAIYGYLASAIVELIAHGVLTGVLSERRKNRVIRGLRDHCIICGYGRVGRRVGREFRDARVPYIVLDFTEDSQHYAAEDKIPYVGGSGTRDEDLDHVGLEHARGLVASSDSDVDNLYIVVSARAARPDLFIVARASTEDAAREDVARRRGSRRPALHRGRPGDGEARAARAGGGVPRHRYERRRARPADAGRGGVRLHQREQDDPRATREPPGRRAHRRAAEVDGTDAEPDAMLEPGDVMIAVGTGAELQALDEMFKPAEAVAR
jgi:hypothetical protein